MDNEPKDASRQRRAVIEMKLRDARRQAQEAASGQDLRNVGEVMQDILELFKHRTNRMPSRDLEACWTLWAETREIIKNRRQEIGDVHYGKFKAEANEAKRLADISPTEARARIRRIQAAMKGQPIAPWQFNKIQTVLNEAWEIITVTREEKHLKWRAGMDTAIARKVALLEKSRDSVANIEHQIHQCQEMLTEARSPEFAATVQGWIDEKYQKIHDIERFISALDDQVHDISVKLNE
jgi:hypothetical protein